MGLRRAALSAAVALSFALSACTTSISVQIADDTWHADCVDVAAGDCEGIVRMFLNNLARSYGWVRDESGGVVKVGRSAICPEDTSGLAQPGACWRANAPTHSARACMIMARRIEPLEGYTFIRIGGDDLTGNFLAPKPGPTPC